MKTPSTAMVSLVCLVAILAPSLARGAVLHVRTDGDDLNSGADWNHAKATVQAAIDIGDEGDQIWVAEGVYAEHLLNRVISETAVNVAIYGGFAGDETSLDQRDPAAHLTILDGTDTGVVVTIRAQAGHGTRIDGFTIRGGYNAIGSGGAVRISVAAPVIANNYFTSNYAEGGVGGAISCFGHKTTPETQSILMANTFVLNRSSDGGAAIGLVGASPEISGSTLVRNYTAGNGGGIGCWTTESAPVCSPDILNNFIYENGANYLLGAALGGGGIFATPDGVDGRVVAGGISAPLIANNIIAANNALTAGGIAVLDSEYEAATITNNTIFANNGAGIYWSGTRPTITNNLVAYNSHGLEQVVVWPVSGATIRFNNVYGNVLQEVGTNYVGVDDPTGLDGNISLEPGMALYDKGKYWLQPGSPCIDAGEDAAVEPGWTDIDGQDRIQDLHVDIGADESDGTLWDTTVPVIHVKPAGDDLRDGLSWENAKATVSAGINAAYLVQANVWVAEGTYAKPSSPESSPFTLPAWVRIYGGFDGTETELSERDVAGHPTILDGGAVPTVVHSTLAGFLVSALDGFTVQNGGIWTAGSGDASLSGIGGGVNVNVSSPYIENCLIRYNSLGNPVNPGYQAEGPGIALRGSFAIIRNNVIRDNENLASDGAGGGLYLSLSRPTIEDNTFLFNHAKRGSAIYSSASTPRIVGNLIDRNSGWVNHLMAGSNHGSIQMTHCTDFLVESNTITGNEAAVGAGVTVQNTRAGQILDNLFYDNRAYDYSASDGGIGGGIYVEVMTSPDDDIEIINNTFSGNDATNTFVGERGGGIGIYAASAQIVIANNVIAFNSSGIYQDPMSTGYVPTLTTNCMYNGADDYVNLSPGPSDMVDDPLFIDRAGDDYHPQSWSPIIEAGTNAAASAIGVDLDGAPRLQDGDYSGVATIDIGCYEYPPDFDSDGTPDWLDPDDDDDGVPDDSDCAPLDGGVWSAPAEVTELLLTHDTATHLSWADQSPGTTFDVVGDALARIREDGNILAAACLANDLLDPAWDDEEPEPTPGSGAYYLVRGQNVCGTGGYGEDSHGAPRLNSSCP